MPSVPPIQSCGYGPGGGTSVPSTFGANVTPGALIVVAVWINGLYTGSITATDDASTPNTYTKDVEYGGGSVYVVLLSAKATIAGTHLTVTVSAPGNTHLIRVFVSEYPRAATPRFDTGSPANSFDQTPPMASLTTAHASEVLVSLGAFNTNAADTIVPQADAGYTVEDVWSGTYGGVVSDLAAGAAGSYSSQMGFSGSPPNGTEFALVLAAYVLASSSVFNESISLGVQASTSPQAALSIAGSVSLGIAGGTADAGAASISATTPLGVAASLSDSILATLAPQASLGVSAGISDTIAATIAAILSLGLSAGTSDQVAVFSSPSVALAIAAAIVDAATVTIQGSAPLAVSGGTGSTASVGVQGGATLGIGAGFSSAAIASLLCSIGLGAQGGVSDSATAAIVDSVSLAISAGTLGSAQAIIAGAIAAGIVQGLTASTGDGAVYNDFIGLGVSAAAQAGAAVGASLAIALSVQAGELSGVRLDANVNTPLGALVSLQDSVLVKAGVNIGLSIGSGLASSASVTFRDQLALAVFAAALARIISPAAARLVVVPLLQRQFLATSGRRALVVPALQRSFIAQEDLMLYLFKHPASTEDFTIDLTALAGTSEVVSISAPAVSGLTIVDRGASPPMAVLRIGGGTAGQGYLISILVTLDSEEVKVVNLTLSVVLVAGVVNATQVPVEKDPRSNENFQLVWSPMLGSTLIAASSWQSSPPVPVTNPAFDDTSASAWLGASANGRFALTNTITTADGQVKACDLYLIVAPQ